MTSSGSKQEDKSYSITEEQKRTLYPRLVKLCQQYGLPTEVAKEMLWKVVDNEILSFE